MKNKPTIKNHFRMVFPARSQNESFARTAIAAFVSVLDPTVEEINDIKAAVSEAVTNCIVHAYGDTDTLGTIDVTARILSDNSVYIRIKDKGCGIADIKQAKQPLFTTCAKGERAGLGFAVMESFTDKLNVYSKVDRGTTVTMSKRLTERLS